LGTNDTLPLALARSHSRGGGDLRAAAAAAAAAAPVAAAALTAAQAETGISLAGGEGLGCTPRESLAGGLCGAAAAARAGRRSCPDADRAPPHTHTLLLGTYIDVIETLLLGFLSAEF
jgi:hypothetical protein